MIIRSHVWIAWFFSHHWYSYNSDGCTTQHWPFPPAHICFYVLNQSVTEQHCRFIIYAHDITCVPNQNKKLYVLVKGTNLFIFQSEHASAPLYAVDLPHRVIALHSPKEEFLNKTCTGSHAEGLKTQIVTLETGLGDVEYSLMFDVSLKENEDLAEKCANAMSKEAKAGETNEVKKVGCLLWIDWLIYFVSFRFLSFFMSTVSCSV